MKIKKMICSMVLCFALSSVAQAETVILKSGKKIEGKILERTPEFTVIEFYGTKLTYYADQIESIVEGTPEDKIKPEIDNQTLSLQADNLQVDAQEQDSFVVYDEQPTNGNSGYTPSGWMGDTQAIKADYNYTDNPHSGSYCQRWVYTGEKTDGAGWAGVFWQNPPNNWGDQDGGFNLSKFSKLTFWARGEKGGERLSFGMGGIKGSYSDSVKVELPKVWLTKEWRRYTIDLRNQDLTRIIGGFSWSVNGADNIGECTFYLDDIVYE